MDTMPTEAKWVIYTARDLCESVAPFETVRIFMCGAIELAKGIRNKELEDYLIDYLDSIEKCYVEIDRKLEAEGKTEDEVPWLELSGLYGDVFSRLDPLED